MIIRDGANIESKLNQIKNIELVVKENLEYKESLSEYIVTPKLKYSTSEVDLDLPTHICLSGKDLDNVALTTSLLKHQVDVVMLNSPTGYDSDLFYYNGEVIKTGSAYYKSKLMYWLHNRIRLAHEMLHPTGVFMILVEDFLLAEVTMLLNSIFGENNKIITHVVITNKAARLKGGVSNQHKYVLVYSMDSELCLQKNSKTVGKSKYYSVPKTSSNNPNIEILSRKYESDGKQIDLTSYIRTQDRRENDSNFYPIYYIPSKSFSKDNIDWSPKLSLTASELPGEEKIYPTLESGKECIWNNSKATCQQRIRDSELVVKVINGKYKVFYKIFDDLDASGEVLEPVKSILDNMSNVAASRRLKEVLGSEDTCLGFHYDLVKYLLQAFSQEGDKVVTINDSNWSVLIGVLESNLNRCIYHLIPEQLKSPSKVLSLLQSTYKSQLMLFESQESSNGCSLEFIDNNKLRQKDFIFYLVGPTAEVYRCKDYSIYETSNYELIVDLHNFYDAEVYARLNKRIANMLNDNSNRVIIFYIEDSEYSLGSALVQHGVFRNLLLYYRTNWNVITRLTL